MLNNYFLSVFMRENQTTMPAADQVFPDEDNNKFGDVLITRQVVQDEIDRLK